MMKIRTIFLAVCLLAGSGGLSAQSTLSLVPQPAEVVRGEGTYCMGRRLSAAADAYPGDSIQLLLDRFGKRLADAAGITLRQTRPSRAELYLKLNQNFPPEGYRLNVTRKGIEVQASRPAGFFYALQTLQQLLPSRALQAGVRDETVREWTVPVVCVTDAPRFGWRGFMLDEGRHFFGKEAVKRVIDVMAAYKMNRFHWHLTEDQGWRLEIKKYPLLTEVGAWRGSRVLGWGEVKPDGERYGGCYTQDDAREIVQYARERFIEIVPEIDIPGHSQAAVAAYPEILACDPDSVHGVWQWQGISDDVINVANPRAVQFAKDVVDELAGIFPFGYLHLGGDECPTDKWERNAACRQRLKEIGSDNYRDLQIDFYRQILEHIAQKPQAERRRVIFWNEVLHGHTDPLGKDIAIMAWVGADKAARDASSRGLPVILSPQIPYYINRRQSPLPTEPRSQGRGTETLEAVYAYEPMKTVPEPLRSRYMGVQANFWTEWVEDARTLEYLMLPRLAAVAEAGWTPQTLRSYPDFLRRMQAEISYYRMKGLHYGRHAWEAGRSHQQEGQDTLQNANQ